MIVAYEINLVEIEHEFMATAALLSCLTCGITIDGMGGPGRHVCKDCGDKIKSGRYKLKLTQ